MSSKVRIWLALILASALAPGLMPATEIVYRLWPKAALVDVAAVHISRVPKHRQRHIRYIDLADVAPKDRAVRLQVLGLVFNSLSRSDLIVLPAAVPDTEGALAWVDLGNYKIDPATFDRLGELGSGPAPQPEPFYHVSTVSVVEGKTETYKEWDARFDTYGRKYYVEVEKVRKTQAVRKNEIALGPHLNRATVLGLATLAESNFPIFNYYWLAYNALTEPRYHEIMGLDDTEASAKKLAVVDRRTADRVGAQIRGAVLLSGVAHHNRILERTPTLLRYGRGAYWESLDFKTSVKAQDVLKDTLNNKPDAREIIFTLPNGLQGYFVVDGKGVRIDKADGDVANNRRFKFRDSQVRTAYHCIACHLPDAGWIDVDDEVRDLSRKTITLIADAFAKDDKRRGERIRQKYLSDDIGDLIKADRAIVEAAVRKATGGLTSAQSARILTEDLRSYLDDQVSVAQLAVMLGYPSEDVLAAMQTKGVDPVFVIMRAGRKGRRDQIESGFAQLATILYAAKRAK